MLIPLPNSHRPSDSYGCSNPPRGGKLSATKFVLTFFASHRHRSVFVTARWHLSIWKRADWSPVISFANLRQSTVRFSHDSEIARSRDSAGTLGRLSAYVCCASATGRKNREFRHRICCLVRPQLLGRAKPAGINLKIRSTGLGGSWCTPTRSSTMWLEIKALAGETHHDEAL